MGAIDGTHISASAPSGRTTAFRDRRSDITQNVMCACNFDMRFTYVHTGWEGSANDSRVMQDALGHAEYEFPWPPRGKKFFLVHLVLDLFFGHLHQYDSFHNCSCSTTELRLTKFRYMSCTYMS